MVDVAIVGGGIFGCSIAWHLARRGITDVVVYERRALGAATTSRAAALLTRLRTKPSQTELMTATRDGIAALEEELGRSLDVNRVGSLQVAASEASEAALLELEQHARKWDEPVAWIEPREAMERAPWLDAHTARRVALFPDDAFIDPYRLALAYADAAKARGVRFEIGVEVTGLARDGARVTGVETAAGVTPAGHVIDAAGPWAGLLAAEVGAQLPMAPVRSHYWITAPADSFPPDSPYVVLPDASAYARPEVGGLLFGLRDRESLSRDPRSLPHDLEQLVFDEDPEGWNVLMESGPRFARFFPGLNDAPLAHYVAGPSTYTPDGQFVLGAVPDVDGFLVATGCCGAGIAASGGVGQALAELVHDGDSTLDLSPFDPGRFGAIDAFSGDWLRRCAQARSRKTSG